MLTLAPFQFFDEHHDKDLFFWGISCTKTFKNLLSVSKIQIGHGLAPLVFALVVNSSTCFKIKNEVYSFGKET
jgi:hypothetical protein